MKTLNKAGFTLIEMMIAVVIAGILSIGIYDVYVANKKGKDVQDQVMSVQQTARVVANELEKDIRMAGYGLDQTNAQPNFVHIGPFEVIFNSDIDSTVSGINPAMMPDQVPSKSGDGVIAYDPPVKYANAETIRWSLDANNDGILNDDDKLINLKNTDQTSNKSIYRLFRQVYGEKSGTNGGALEVVGETIKGPVSYLDSTFPKPLFTFWINEDEDGDGVLSAEEVDVNGNGVADEYLWGDDGSGGGTASNGTLENGEIGALYIGNSGKPKILNYFETKVTAGNGDKRLADPVLPPTTLKAEISRISRIDISVTGETAKEDPSYKNSPRNYGGSTYNFREQIVTSSAKPRNPIEEVESYPTLILSASPSVVVCPATNSVITAVARDKNTDPISGATVAFSTSGGSFSAAGGSDTVTKTTGADGQAIVTFYGVNVGSSVATISATGTIDGNSYSGMATVDFKGGDPAIVTMTATPQNLSANGSDTSKIEATVKDSCGNFVKDGTVVTFSYKATPDGIGGVIKSSSEVTASGKASIILVSATSTGTGTITATSGAAVNSITVDYTPCVLTLSPEKNSIPNDAISTSNIGFTLTDITGNPIQGDSVFFKTDDGTISPANVTSNISGTGVTVLKSSKIPHIATISGTVSGGVCLNTTDTTNVEFTVAGCDVEFVSNKTQLTLNETASLTGTFIYTESKAPAAGETITLTMDNDAMGTLGSKSIITDAAGKVSTTFTAGTAMGNVQITMNTNCGSRSITIPIKSCIAEMSAAPQMLPPDGITESVATVILTDKLTGLPVANTEVVFTVTGVITSSYTVTTDVTGTASIALTSNTAGTATVTAKAWCSEASAINISFNDWDLILTGDASAVTNGIASLTVKTLKDGILSQPPAGSSNVLLTFTDGGAGLGSGFSTNPVILSSGAGTSKMNAGLTTGTVTVQAEITIGGVTLTSSQNITINEGGGLIFYDAGSAKTTGSKNHILLFNIVNGHGQTATLDSMNIIWTKTGAYLDHITANFKGSDVKLWQYFDPVSSCGGGNIRGSSGATEKISCKAVTIASSGKLAFTDLTFLDKVSGAGAKKDMRGSTFTIVIYYKLTGDSTLYSSTITFSIP